MAKNVRWRQYDRENETKCLLATFLDLRKRLFHANSGYGCRFSQPCCTPRTIHNYQAANCAEGIENDASIRHIKIIFSLKRRRICWKCDCCCLLFERHCGRSCSRKIKNEKSYENDAFIQHMNAELFSLFHFISKTIKLNTNVSVIDTNLSNRIHGMVVVHERLLCAGLVSRFGHWNMSMRCTYWTSEQLDRYTRQCYRDTIETIIAATTTENMIWFNLGICWKFYWR